MRTPLFIALMVWTTQASAASVGYVSFGTGAENTANVQNLNTVFAAPSTWQSLGAGNLSGSISSYNFLFIDGGTASGNAFATWMASNLTTVQNYVAAGGRLYIDTGGGGGPSSVSAGFGGIEFRRETGSIPGNTGVAVNAANPIFSNGAGLTWSASGNTDFASDYIYAPPGVGTPLIRDASNGNTLLLEQTWGNGMVWFGGFEATQMQPAFQTPTAILFQNMLQYMANAPPPNPGVPEPSELVLLAVGLLSLMAFRSHKRVTRADMTPRSPG